MEYIIYIQQKRLQECDGLELYIKQQLKNKLITFIPNRTAICIKDLVIEGDEEGGQE